MLLVRAIVFFLSRELLLLTVSYEGLREASIRASINPDAARHESQTFPDTATWGELIMVGCGV